MSRRTQSEHETWGWRIRHLHRRRTSLPPIGVWGGSPRGLRLMLPLLLIVTGAWLVVGRLDVWRMSATADAFVVWSRVQGRSGFEQSPSGLWIRYEYTVGGITYPGQDFERWSSVAAYRPKVCYDPARPADHRLVSGDKVCGVSP